MIDPYLAMKWVHILSSTVLFGTGIGTAFQMVWAMYKGDANQVHGVASGVVVADWIFTTPAGIVQPLSGAWLIWQAGYSWSEPWLVVTYALYVVAFLCWAPVVHLQIRIRDLCTDAQGPVPEQARRLYRIWFALGWPAFLALMLVFWLMVNKPPLWA